MVQINKEESNAINIGALGIVNANNNLYVNTNKYIHTKFLIPRNPVNCLNRVNLLEKMDEITGKKLTMLTGPAGFGKTTLASMWLMEHDLELKSCWISLNDNDNNALRFWHCVIVSINRTISGYLDEDIVIYPDLINGSLEIMLNGLINWLSGMHCDIVLVMDDYHLIYNENIHQSMYYFINNMPENMHIVLISRIIPPIKIARLRGHGKLLEIKAKDLKLSSIEIIEFLDRNMKLCLAENEVKRLEEYTEGWITALKLTALKIRNSSCEKKHLIDLNYMNEFVFEYISEEVFNLLDFNIRDFLQKTSILDTLNSSLCDEVADICNSKEIIHRLEKNNIFIHVLDDEKINYRYNSIFKEFLRNRLIRICEDTIEVLYLRASSWYEKNNMMLEALEYSGKSNNHQNTARLIGKYGELMIINRDFVRVGKLIEALPEKLLTEKPFLCALYTLAVTTKNSESRDDILIGNITVSIENDIFHKSEMELLLIRMMLAYVNSDFQAALEYVNQIVSIMSNKSMIQCIPYKILCQIHSEIGNLKEAEKFLSLFISSVQSQNYFDEFFIETLNVHMMVNIYCGAGKYKNALDIIKRFEVKMCADNLSMPIIVNSVYLDFGYLYYEYCELALSHKSVNKCIELCQKNMDVFRLISGYVLVARIMKSEGKHDDVMEYIGKAEKLCDRYNSRIMMVNLFIYIVRTLLEIGEIEYIEHLINKYNIIVQDSSHVVYENAHLALADFYIAKGEYSKSEDILDKLHKTVINSERNLSFVRIMILKALLAKYKGNEAEALKYMKEAIEGGYEQEYISTFADFGIPVAEIICKLLKQKEDAGITNEKYVYYANCLLSHIKKLPKLIFKTDMELMEHISKRELEVLKYLLSGLTNKEIASKLYIAECTVKKHINSIYAKIGAVNRDQAIQICEKMSR